MIRKFVNNIIVAVKIRQDDRGKISRGAVFIEFAFSIPVLIAILYYMHDAPRYKRINSRMEFCAHCMANVLQNVSNGQRITVQNIKNALALAYLSDYPGKTEYGTGSHRLPFGHFPHAWIYYVKGLSGGKASVIWACVPYIDSTYVNADIKSSQHAGSTVNYAQNVAPSSIYNGLKINENQVKIIIECCHYYPTNNYYFSDGRSCSAVSVSRAFGLLFLTPKSCSPNGAGYFTNVAIFTPKPGLFSESAPN